MADAGQADTQLPQPLHSISSRIGTDVFPTCGRKLIALFGQDSPQAVQSVPLFVKQELAMKALTCQGFSSGGRSPPGSQTCEHLPQKVQPPLEKSTSG